MAPDDSNAAFARALRRFQRRLRLMAFVRYVPVAGAIALGGIDVVVLAWRQDGGAIVVSAGSIVLAMVAAYGVAVLRTPTLSVTARTVDRELGLQDRAASALEFSQATDAMSRLVVADAASHLQKVPASRLPLSVPAPARWLAVSALAVSALIFMLLARSTSDWSPMSDSSSMTSPGRAAGDAARRTQGSRARRVSPGAGSVVNNGRDNAPASGAKPGVPAEQANSAGGRSGEGATGRSDSTAPKPEAGDRAQDPRASPPSSGSSAASGFGASSTGSGRARGGAARGSSSGLSATGRSASVPTDEGAGGGVGGGALVSGSRAAGSKSPTISNRQTAAYAAAYARAESATPIERVPAGLRSYVRAYFLAIRPDQWR